jgi:hypothetical protein
MTLTNNNPIACQPEREREREMIKEKNWWTHKALKKKAPNTPVRSGYTL